MFRKFYKPSLLLEYTTNTSTALIFVDVSFKQISITMIDLTH